MLQNLIVPYVDMVEQHLHLEPTLPRIWRNVRQSECLASTLAEQWLRAGEALITGIQLSDVMRFRIKFLWPCRGSFCGVVLMRYNSAGGNSYTKCLAPLHDT